MTVDTRSGCCGGNTQYMFKVSSEIDAVVKSALALSLAIRN
jgi:hypothetical protein